MLWSMNIFNEEEDTWGMAGTPKSKDMKIKEDSWVGWKISSMLGQEFRMSEFVMEGAKIF